MHRCTGQIVYCSSLSSGRTVDGHKNKAVKHSISLLCWLLLLRTVAVSVLHQLSMARVRCRLCLVVVVLISSCVMFVRSFKAQKQHVRHLQLFAAKPHAFLSPALYAHTKKALFRTNSVRMMSGSTPDESKAVEKKPRKGKGGKAAEEPPSQTIEEIRLVRQQKMEAFRAEGTNPFAYTFDVSHSSSQLHDLYKDLGNGLEDTSAHVSIAGRVILRRVFGKLAFFTLQDSVGTIQLYLDKNRLNNDFDRLRDLVDAGDIIGVQGTLKRTDKGELSVYVSNWSILTKSMTPLPDKYRGFTDVNKRYRARQLDLIANPEVRDVFRRRAHIISGIRHTLDSLGYLEVETPILQTQPGGAEAKPFEVHRLHKFPHRFLS